MKRAGFHWNLIKGVTLPSWNYCVCEVWFIITTHFVYFSQVFYSYSKQFNQGTTVTKSESNRISLSAAQLSVTLTGLVPDTDYRVVIRASTSKGLGVNSTVVSFRTPKAARTL